MKPQEPQERLTDRIAWRINEWCELTNTSRPTAWRQAKSGKLKLAYVDKTPYVTRAEAIRLGFIEILNVADSDKPRGLRPRGSAGFVVSR